MAMEQSSDTASMFSTEASISELKMGSKNLFSSKYIYKSKLCYALELIMSVSARFVRKAFFFVTQLRRWCDASKNYEDKDPHTH